MAKNEPLILPELPFNEKKSYLGILVTRLFIGKVSKHEYAFALTISRLIHKIFNDYEEARNSTLEIYDNRYTLQLTSYLDVSNSLESLVTDIYRVAITLKSLIKQYPEYKNILPDEAEKIVSEIIKKTSQLRHDAEHIYNRVIGEKTKKPKKVGLVTFGIDEQYILIANNKLSIKKLIKWLQYLNDYSDAISLSFDKFTPK